MIVCSCNVFSDHQLRSTLANATQRLRISQIYDCLGCSAQCGRCAHTIKRIMGGNDKLRESALLPRARTCTRERNNENSRRQGLP